MVFSHKIYNNIDLDNSSSSDSDNEFLDNHQIAELEKKLILNYKLLLRKKNEIKKKKR